MEDYYQVYDRIRRSVPSRGEKSQKEKQKSVSHIKSDSRNIRASRIITHQQQWQLLHFMKMCDMKMFIHMKK